MGVGFPAALKNGTHHGRQSGRKSTASPLTPADIGNLLQTHAKDRLSNALRVRVRLRRTSNMPQSGEDGTFHTNPKRERGRDLHPRLRFGLVSASTARGIVCHSPRRVSGRQGKTGFGRSLASREIKTSRRVNSRRSEGPLNLAELSPPLETTRRSDTGVHASLQVGNGQMSPQCDTQFEKKMRSSF